MGSALKANVLTSRAFFMALGHAEDEMEGLGAVER